MKMRILAAASVLLTVVLVAAISHAAPSCCDPKNGSTPGALFAPGQPTQGTIPAASPQRRVVTPQVTPAMVRATGSNWSGPVPQRQVAASRPVGLPNAPAAPSCCTGPNNSGPSRGINPASQAQFRGCGGCGGCGGAGGQASYSGFQPVGEFCPHRIRQTPASRCSLWPRPPVAQQQGPATTKGAGTHRSLRSSEGYGEFVSWNDDMSGPHLPLWKGEGRWANQLLITAFHKCGAACPVGPASLPAVDQ